MNLVNIKIRIGVHFAVCGTMRDCSYCMIVGVSLETYEPKGLAKSVKGTWTWNLVAR